MSDKNSNLFEEVKELRARVKHLEASQAEKERAKQMLDDITQSITEGIMLLSKDYKIKWANRAALHRTGLSAGELIGNYCYRTERKREQPCGPGASCPVSELLKTKGPKCERHAHYEKKDGSFFAEVSAYPIKNDSGEIVEIVHLSRDITGKKNMEEELRVLSYTDELTGLYNRRGFFTFVQHEQKMARRQKKGIYMLYADLDGLKEINDTYGHLEGDKTLKEMAAVFKETFRESDIIARLGGDEFAVIPIGTTSEEVRIITDRLEKNIEIHNSKETSRHKLSVSWGLSYLDPANPLSIDALLSNADRAMYEQKQQKKQSYH